MVSPDLISMVSPDLSIAPVWEVAGNWRALHSLGVDPGHEAAKALADLFDGMLALEAFVRVEDRAIGPVLEDPFPGELAGADLAQDLLHLGAGLLVDDPRPARVVAVLRGVRDTVAHVVEPALVHQVDDQFELVQALEVCALGLVPRFDQGFEGHLHERTHPAAKD